MPIHNPSLAYIWLSYSCPSKNGSGQIKDCPEPFFRSRFPPSMEDADCTAFCKGICLFVLLALWNWQYQISGNTAPRLTLSSNLSPVYPGRHRPSVLHQLFQNGYKFKTVHFYSQWFWLTADIHHPFQSSIIHVYPPFHTHRPVVWKNYIGLYINNFTAVLSIYCMIIIRSINLWLFSQSIFHK